MDKSKKDPVIVVLQLTGGNDYLNTVIPYEDSNYYDSRPSLSIPGDKALKFADGFGFHPEMKGISDLYSKGQVAVINGIGYENPSRSHFRSMDIWHTAEPDKIESEGWLGKSIRLIDPLGENPVTAVNIGQGLPRALSAQGAAVTSLATLGGYGLLTGIENDIERSALLDKFQAMYTPAVGRGLVMEYLSRTGTDLLNGIDILKPIPENYTSKVEYAQSSVAQNLRDIAMKHTANVGTQIFYLEHGSFDTHGMQEITHSRLWKEVSSAITDFWDDLVDHDAHENVIMLVFSEFGRRVRDNGSGTDHGAAGVTFVIGPSVVGGMYGEYTKTDMGALIEGDLASTLDFRTVYAELLDSWMALDSREVIANHVETQKFIRV